MIEGLSAMEKNEIYVGIGSNYKQMAFRAAEWSGLEKMIPSKEAKIAIKPNLLGPIPAKEGATTHPEVVAGLMEYLFQKGFHHVEIMEGSWVGDKTQDSVECCGFDALCERYGVPFIDLQKDTGVVTDCSGVPIKICSHALEADFLINVPVLKGHCQTRMTCALKNMKGVIPNAEKRRFHRMGLFDPIGHLSAGIHQDFILVDSICGDLTFEDGGHPVQQDRLIAGRDPVLIDAFGAQLLGLELSEVPYIGIAQSCGIGSSDVSNAHIYTERKGCPARTDSGADFLSSQDRTDKNSGAGERTDGPGPGKNLRASLSFMDKAEEIESCSACFAALAPALERLDRETLLEKLDVKVCIGQGFRGRGGELGIGSCTSGFDHSLPGCPPDSENIYNFLKNYLENL